MKVLFLDIDGVVNCKDTMQRHRGFIGIDPYMAFLIGKIVLDTGVSIVLSSTWRLDEHSREEVRSQVYDFIDITPHLAGGMRGEEIQAWLDKHPEVERYAILDDDTQILDSQKPNWFRTFWEKGITKEIAEKVTEHFNSYGGISSTDE